MGTYILAYCQCTFYIIQNSLLRVVFQCIDNTFNAILSKEALGPGAHATSQNNGNSFLG